LTNYSGWIEYHPDNVPQLEEKYMRNAIALIAAVSLAATSCTLIRTKMKVEDVVAEKVKIDSTTNLARKYLILNDLNKKSVVLENILVKEIIPSTNIDYEFCIVADIVVEDKKVECHIYTKNMYKMANLQEGISRINVVGDFKRFFTMLDEYYTKIEIVQAKVSLYDPTKDKKAAEVKGKDVKATDDKSNDAKATDDKSKDAKAADDKSKDVKKKSDDNKQGGARP
jgi:hypothetical protein